MTGVPPAAAPGASSAVKLWLCANDDLPDAIAGVLATHWLDGPEKETAERFMFERDRRQYVVAHTLVRRALAMEVGLVEPELLIWRSPRGRPSLQYPAGGLPRGGPELDFNLSHASGYNLLGVVRRQRIGVDIERLDRDAGALETIARAYSPGEQSWVGQARVASAAWKRRVLRLWTLKEAYSKARGLGLGLDFDSFAFTLADEQGVLGFQAPADDTAGAWIFIELEPLPGVLVAVAVQADRGPLPELQLYQGFPWKRFEPQLFSLPEPVRDGGHGLLIS
ncbi:4'-phosphopantetheinyl transferase superfamily protein [Streptomyces sp. MK7]|uniref:4'-phosphopantetheinyl transferase family protein n=1 Tax=Streptomyces sp. MK7 TaxID=3067635 RepID=UPI00292DE95F|nr:4'-phosphopantetheinyl transferase superfamily protein [Streptomyces sp. MK7]